MTVQTESAATVSGVVGSKSLYLIPFTLLVLFVVSRVKAWWRLRHFKGPWLASFSSLPMAKIAMSGKMYATYTEINKKYGNSPFLPLCPFFLSFILLKSACRYTSPNLRMRSLMIYKVISPASDPTTCFAVIQKLSGTCPPPGPTGTVPTGMMPCHWMYTVTT